MKKLKNSLVIVFAFIAGSLVSIATTAVLAHGGDASKIHGCVRNNGLLAGFIRVVGANDNCNNNETALDWNIQGPQGPAGPTASGSAYFGLTFTCYKCDLTSIADKFKGKDFSNAFIPGTGFYDVDLSGIILKNGYLEGLKVNGSNLSNADLSDAQFSNIHGSYLGNATFQGTNLQNANLQNNDLSNGSFQNANLQNTNFTNANFSAADFLGAQNMDTANLTGVTWNNTTCPDGTNSDNNGNTCIGHLTP